MQPSDDPAFPKDIDDYLSAVPEPHRTTLTAVRKIISECVPPGTTEAISYKIPAFRYKGALIGFAAFTKHCSLFPMSATITDKFQMELSRYHTSKGTI